MAAGKVLMGAPLFFLMVLASCGADSPVNESPLAQFLGEDALLVGDQGEQAQRLVDIELERQEAIAECMSEAGFEYVPNDPALYGLVTTPSDGPEWGSRPWVERYGLGITTMAFGQSQVGPDLVGVPDGAGGDDPNLAIVAGLTPQKQEAYLEALVSGGGDSCAYRASVETPDPLGVILIEFAAELSDIQRLVANDPDVVAAETELTSCLFQQGLAFSSFSDLTLDLELGLEEIRADLALQVEPAGFAMLGPESLAALGELQAVETAYAVAMEECDYGYHTRRALWARISVPYEQEFINQNRPRLEELIGGSK